MIHPQFVRDSHLVDLKLCSTLYQILVNLFGFCFLSLDLILLTTPISQDLRSLLSYPSSLTRDLVKLLSFRVQILGVLF